ncbi:MAG: hypothetical protein ACPIOQ_60855 [Promethearchaeia archaeon]
MPAAGGRGEVAEEEAAGADVDSSAAGVCAQAHDAFDIENPLGAGAAAPSSEHSEYSETVQRLLNNIKRKEKEAAASGVGFSGPVQDQWRLGSESESKAGERPPPLLVGDEAAPEEVELSTFSITKKYYTDAYDSARDSSPGQNGSSEPAALTYHRQLSAAESAGGAARPGTNTENEMNARGPNGVQGVGTLEAGKPRTDASTPGQHESLPAPSPSTSLSRSRCVCAHALCSLPQNNTHACTRPQTHTRAHTLAPADEAACNPAGLEADHDNSRTEKQPALRDAPAQHHPVLQPGADDAPAPATPRHLPTQRRT